MHDAPSAPTVRDGAAHGTPTPTHQGRDMRPAPGVLLRPSPRSPRSVSWVRTLLQQGRRAPMNRELGLEFTDSLTSREQLPALTRRQTGVDPSVDAVLATPRIDRLLADTEIRGNLPDLAARRNELQNAATELRRITLPRHAALPKGTASESSNPTPRNPGQTTPYLG